jgi:tetratricopeptide (TPR) repeat protein
VSTTTPKPHDFVQAQVEALTDTAKKLSSTGKEAQALEAYKQAAALMPGAPWLQNRTAELARKLRQPEVAASHYRRAAAAFIGAGFPKRALTPLRTAWQVSAGLLPGDASAFIAITLELAKVQRELGSASDAKLSIINANQALRASGRSDRVPTNSDAELRSTRPPAHSESTQPPESGVQHNSQAPSRSSNA